MHISHAADGGGKHRGQILVITASKALCCAWSFITLWRVCRLWYALPPHTSAGAETDGTGREQAAFVSCPFCLKKKREVIHSTVPLFCLSRLSYSFLNYSFYRPSILSFPSFLLIFKLFILPSLYSVFFFFLSFFLSFLLLFVLFFTQSLISFKRSAFLTRNGLF